MPCCLGVLALIAPRIVFGCVWLFTHYITMAYTTWIWPLLALIFMPLTGLAYAFSINTYGSVRSWGLVLLIVAVVFDVGSWGGGRGARRGRGT
jgi:hypothetical protein